ncbi:MAG: VLRF1 family aeRF1-type release factor [Solirubrobacterales bacterium]
MRFTDGDTVRELIDWKPPSGVISVFVDADPADRDEAWRIELKDGLDAACNGHDEVAFRATVERINDHFPPRGGAREGLSRFSVGFVEVARKPGREQWATFDGPPVATIVRHGDGPFIAPLLALVDRPATAGVVTLSTDQVEIFDWRLGAVTQIETTEFEQPTWWRERKSPVVDASRGTTTSSSGRDQYDERLDEARTHYLAEVGEKVRALKRKHGWQAVIAIGGETCYRAFVGHLPDDLPPLVDQRVLTNHPPSEIAEIANRYFDHVEEERVRALLDRATTAVLAAEGRGAAGIEDVFAALADGRVSHLVYDARTDFDGRLNQMLERSVATGATVTSLRSDRAVALDDHGGVVALLRY